MSLQKTRNKSFFCEIRKNWLYYVMFLPAGLYFFIFAYVPMPGIVVAFKNYSYRGGIFGSEWNGLENFRYFYESGKLLLVTWNTLKYNLLFLVTSTILSVAAAILIAEMQGIWFKKTSQTLMFLPHFISWVIVAVFFYNIFNFEYGSLNTFLKTLGIPPVSIYSEPGVWIFILPFLYIWKTIGFSSVLYLSAIMGIDKESYETAMIDGANVFRRIWHITLPMLSSTIITLTLLGISRIMRGQFDMFYQLIGNNSKLMDATDIIDTLVFRSLITTNDFGMASSAGFYQSVLCFAIIVMVNQITKKISKENALF